MGRAAAALAAALALCACAPPVDRLLADLKRDPAKLPDPTPKGTPTLLYLVRLQGGAITLANGPIVLPQETLALERALAARRDTAPPYWAVVIRPDDRPAWWSPMDPVAKVRLSHANDGSFTAEGGASSPTEMIVALRVPKLPGGRVVFYDAAGRASGEIEMGP
jgi:hypothetical protein